MSGLYKNPVNKATLKAEKRGLFAWGCARAKSCSPRSLVKMCHMVTGGFHPSTNGPLMEGMNQTVAIDNMNSIFICYENL